MLDDDDVDEKIVGILALDSNSLVRALKPSAAGVSAGQGRRVLVQTAQRPKRVIIQARMKE